MSQKWEFRSSDFWMQEEHPGFLPFPQLLEAADQHRGGFAVLAASGQDAVAAIASRSSNAFAISNITVTKTCWLACARGSV